MCTKLAVSLIATAMVGYFTAAPALALPNTTFAVTQLRDLSCSGVRLQEVDLGGATLGTSASADVNASAPMNCSEPFVNVPWDGFAIAGADLTSGVLRATAFASSAPPSGVHGLIIDTRARAQFADTIFLHGLEDAGDILNIVLTTDGLVQSTGTGVITYGACLGISYGAADPAATVQCQTWTNVPPNGDPNFGVPTSMDVSFAISRPILATSAPINIVAGLSVAAWDGWLAGKATVDLGHTAQLSIDLPDGVTFTSQSGVLLTGSAASIPEPAPFSVLLAGAAGLLARRTYRQGRRAARSTVI